MQDFAYVIPHQVNGNIDNILSEYLGNLGSDAIWVSFTNLLNSNKLKEVDLVLVLGAEATKYIYGGFIYKH